MTQKSGIYIYIYICYFVCILLFKLVQNHGLEPASTMLQGKQKQENMKTKKTDEEEKEDEEEETKINAV